MSKPRVVRRHPGRPKKPKPREPVRKISVAGVYQSVWNQIHATARRNKMTYGEVLNWLLPIALESTLEVPIHKPLPPDPEPLDE